MIKIDINSLNTKDKIDNLIATLDDKNTYKLNFMNIKSLPKDLILKMQSIKKNLIITIDNTKLHYYLINLGFDTILKNNKKNYQSDLLENINYIAIAGSAGSLEKIIDIVKFLPKSNLVLFIIMHRKKDQKDYLKDILKKHTIYYDIVSVNTTTKIKPATIYIAPTSEHLIIKNNYLLLDNSDAKHFAKPSISVAFESFAKELRSKFLAIILCGYGSDGSDSLELIKKTGGYVIIEQPFECKASSIIEAAINTNQYDKILSVNDISKLIYDKYYKKYTIEKNLTSFLNDLKKTYNYDYSGYNKKHIIRRIEHYYNILKTNNFSSFKDKILNDKKLFEELFLDLSVNTTTFFRDPEVFIELKDVFKNIFKENKSIKIWCAGCSSGEEPYSIAILLEELGLLNRAIIYATDINNTILQFAKNGLYSKHSYKEFKNNFTIVHPNSDFDKYFTINNEFVSINDNIKENILFFKHNLVENEKIDDFQVIICRNLIIYFDKVLTKQVFDLFDNSLDKNGVLILGSSETFYNRYNYDVISKTNRIFLKGNNIG